jgi:DNA-binding SARP family transcriptional activator/tetratricopeptide (TPR) repeat protein
MSVTIRLLGGFEVSLDGEPVPASAWTRRHAASLVKLLAISPGRRRHREQVVDALWPGLTLDVAGPRLHKAAHYARRALGDTRDCLVLRSDLVALLPDVDVRVDALEFQRLAEAALSAGTPAAAAEALGEWQGGFLPDNLYDEWTEGAREALRLLHLDLLRQAGRWEDLLREEPGDEQAHLALIRASHKRGDVRGALRQLERMDQALRRGLGIVPSPEVERLRTELQAEVFAEGAMPTDRPVVPIHRASSATRLYGRKDVGDQVRQAMDRADTGRGGALLMSGPPGVGKTALLDMSMALAARRGWRTGRGTASSVEGPWPYAPVLEALSDLCRQHPALLDGLDDVYRGELERGLSGRDVDWSGESGHQRFFVAAAELVRLAATGHGLLLVVDDVHEADQASLRLLHYLSRVAVNEPVLLALTHRPTTGEAASEMLDSLARRGMGTRIEVGPLPQRAARRLLADAFPELDDAIAEEIWAVSAGLPFTVLELARSGSTGGGGGPLPALPGPVLGTFQRVALLGTTFTTDELLAVSGVGEDESYRHLEVGLAALLVEPDPAGYRFRHALLREALLAAMPPHTVAAARREVAEQLVVLDAAPARIAHQFLAAGSPSRAVPYVVRAVDTAGALGAYRDALTLVDAVRAHAGPDDLPPLLARRGDLRMALGDPEAVSAYREALAVTTRTEHRLVRARLARAASFVHDLDTARAALAGLQPEDDAADGPILLARGNLAYFDGDIDTAWNVAGQARELLQEAADPWQLVDLVSLQGLIAHQRGEWFERFRLELRRTQGRQRLATSLFDAHLCVAEYLLYGPVPYAEVIRDAEELRRRATQAGALRGVAFASALIGEAALLNGDLELAERELVEAVDLHREIDAPAGEAHSLQRLAETRLAQGDRDEAQRLLNLALPLAHYSAISLHLLQRIYGTMIEAAPDPDAARAVVERAETAMGETDRCTFCVIMLAVPAAIACANVGDVADARRHLEVAQESAARWSGSSWQAAVLEARAYLARAEGNDNEFRQLLGEAEQTFIAAGHPLEAARCARAASTQVLRPQVEPMT